MSPFIITWLLSKILASSVTAFGTSGACACLQNSYRSHKHESPSKKVGRVISVMIECLDS